MKVFRFEVVLEGKGINEEDAFDNAIVEYLNDPGEPYKVTEILEEPEEPEVTL